jgi:solute carrier family 35 (UDP-sugar transporter), member A1/2/3
MPSSEASPQWLKTTALLLLIAQNVSLVLTMKVSLGDGSAPYIVTVAVLLAELLKLIICLIVIYLYIKKPFNWGSVWSVEGLKMAVPALLYVVQNNMLFFAVSRLEPAVFQITYQLKIATTAFFSVVMLKRSLSRAQYVGLGCLLPGVCLVQLSRLSNANHHSLSVVNVAPSDINFENNVENNIHLSAMDQSNEMVAEPSPLALVGENNSVSLFGQILGFLAVLISCVTSGFAGVYFEKVLKSAKDLTLWERNVQLAVYSIFIALASVITKDFKRVMHDGPFSGMSLSSWIVIILQAAGGLVIAVVVKHTDNIAKAFATSVSVIISCLLCILFFDFHPQMTFFVGAALVGLAVRFYSSKPGDWLVKFILVECLGLQDTDSKLLP